MPLWVTKERCLGCDTGRERDPEMPRQPCPRSGEPKLDQEFDLDDCLGARDHYEIIGRRTDLNQILTSELRGVNIPHPPPRLSRTA
jgi:hypothetical protein